MSTDQTRHFSTLGPLTLDVEIGKGSVSVEVAPTTESSVTVTGREADRVRVELDGDRLIVHQPQRTGFLSSTGEVHVHAVVPLASTVEGRTGSAGLTVSGLPAALRWKSGSGDLRATGVDGDLAVATGSGDVRVGDVAGEVQVKSGSGDIDLGRATGPVAVSTGSGDVRLLAAAHGAQVKTGSGDLALGEAEGQVSLRTGSGDLVVGATTAGRFDVKGASSDVRIGVRAGSPVWTDVHTVTGTIRSTLPSTGAPAEGAPYVEVRATTVSGDIHLGPA